MNAADMANQLLAVLQTLIPAIERLLMVARRANLWPMYGAAYSYENLSLSLDLELVDRAGKRALVRRHQLVRFLSSEAGVITNPISGEGELLESYRVDGARKAGLRREGSSQVILLRLPERPVRGTTVSLTSQRQIRNAFRRDREYFEATVERPTRHLKLRAIFPKGRPPRDAVIVSSSRGVLSKLAPRLDTHGRAVLTWSKRLVSPGSQYSMRWSW